MDVMNDDLDTNTDKRPPAILLGLPDELAEWADQNQSLILRVHKSLADSYATLTEEQIWEAVASAASPEWREARESLRIAEENWQRKHRPENAPLGPIGHALDSDETGHLRERFDISLSDFTIINEGLRQRQDLRNLLSVLLVQKRMVDQSAARTVATRQATAQLDGIMSLSDEFRKAARRHGVLRRHFKLYGKKLFKREAREPAPISATVPWLPGT